MNKLSEEQKICLKIITKWINTVVDIKKRKILFIIQDMIYDDLTYTRKNKTIKKVSSFLSSGDQKNEELQRIRKCVNL